MQQSNYLIFIKLCVHLLKAHIHAPDKEEQLLMYEDMMTYSHSHHSEYCRLHMNEITQSKVTIATSSKAGQIQ